MLSQTQINSLLKYIIFFAVIYIFTCFLDKKSVYFYLFIIFILACFCKLAFFSNTQTLIRISWGFLGLCVLALFATKINENNDNSDGQEISFFSFGYLISILAELGNVIKSIFLDSLLTYMFLFMVLGTLYGSLLSQGNPNLGILGWVIGMALGFCIWFFLSQPESVE